MSNMFSDLQKVKEEQANSLKNSNPPPVKEQKTLLGRDAQKVAHKPAQLSKPLSKNLSKSLSQDAIEELAFRLRKTPQSKINANIPLEWREKFDEIAFKLKVGKYELLTYIVGVFLGEVEQPEP